MPRDTLYIKGLTDLRRIKAVPCLFSSLPDPGLDISLTAHVVLEDDGRCLGMVSCGKHYHSPIAYGMAIVVDQVSLDYWPLVGSTTKFVPCKCGSLISMIKQAWRARSLVGQGLYWLYSSVEGFFSHRCSESCSTCKSLLGLFHTRLLAGFYICLGPI